MSAWRIALRELHAAGGLADGRAFGDSDGRRALVRMGLATWKHTAESVITWTLTDLGREVAEGRLVRVVVRPGGRRWAATWLRSLPCLAMTDNGPGVTA